MAGNYHRRHARIRPQPVSPTVPVLGIRPWKRWQIDRLLGPHYGRFRYQASAAGLLRRRDLEGREVLVWASREPEGFEQALSQRGARLLRMEDGFLRSVGLGSNHVGGSSLVVDALGIYYDPTRPSALERLLQDEPADAALLERAARLRAQLVAQGLTKYNVGAREGPRLDAPAGRVRLLVPGQVEDDASVRKGAPPELRSNLALLERVRAENPQAWIVYKPHPDTEAGTRRGRVADAMLRRHADAIVRDCSVTALFPQVDAVHTLTSLVGFEALLRGVEVHTWGAPFYAGWGLTRDRQPTPRRTRRLTLDALVAGTLIRYPLYMHPDTGVPCEVETLADWLAARGTAQAADERARWRRWSRQGQGLLRMLAGRSA